MLVTSEEVRGLYGASDKPVHPTQQPAIEHKRPAQNRQ